MQENVNYTTFNTSSAGGEAESSPLDMEETSEVENTSEESSEDISEESSENYTESVYIDYTEQFNQLNTKLEATFVVLFITLSLFVTIIIFRVFNWFFKDL